MHGSKINPVFFSLFVTLLRKRALLQWRLSRQQGKWNAALGLRLSQRHLFHRLGSWTRGTKAVIWLSDVVEAPWISQAELSGRKGQGGWSGNMVSDFFFFKDYWLIFNNLKHQWNRIMSQLVVVNKKQNWVLFVLSCWNSPPFTLF